MNLLNKLFCKIYLVTSKNTTKEIFLKEIFLKEFIKKNTLKEFI